MLKPRTDGMRADQIETCWAFLADAPPQRVYGCAWTVCTVFERRLKFPGAICKITQVRGIDTIPRSNASPAQTFWYAPSPTGQTCLRLNTSGRTKPRLRNRHKWRRLGQGGMPMANNAVENDVAGVLA